MAGMAPNAESINLRANAKLNLFLRVLGRRSDGYHELESIFHTVALADDLSLTPSDEGVDVSMSFAAGVSGDPPVSEDNLSFRAARSLIERAGLDRGARIEIVKRIPIGSGMGGGSADAAAAIAGLNELWGLDLEQSEVLKVAGLIGSDVPFCLSGGTALVMGRGEELTPLPCREPLHFVLCMSFEPLATRSVYERWRPESALGDAGSAPMALALGTGDVEGVAASLHNDLEAPAFELRPELADKKQAVLDAGALGACMSGSGPTIFGIARDSDDARRLATLLGPDFDHVVAVQSAPRGIERDP